MPRPTTHDTPLGDRLRRHPGGIAELASRTGYTDQALYNLAAGRHVRPPYRLLRALAPVMGVEVDALVRLWRRSR